MSRACPNRGHQPSVTIGSLRQVRWWVLLAVSVAAFLSVAPANAAHRGADGFGGAVVQPPTLGALERLLASTRADVTGTITPGGPAVTSTISTAGDRIRLTFDGTAGQRVSALFSGVTIGSSCCTGIYVWIANPDGSVLGSQLLIGKNGGFIDTKTLPTTGNYSIYIDPNSTQTGNATVTAYGVPADATGVFTPVSGAGHTLTFTTTTPGQNVAASFQGTSGQRISVNYTAISMAGSCCFNVHTSIKRPDGSLIVGDREFGSNGTFVDTTILNATGTYTIVVDAESTRTGSITITAYDVPADVTGVFTPVSGAGHALTFTTNTPGQNIAPTFQGTTGQRISVNYTGSTIAGSCCFNNHTSIKRPDGSLIVADREFGNDGTFVDTTILNATGTYTIVDNPEGARIGSITLTAYDVPADITGVFTPVSGAGHALTFTTNTPGQNIAPTFQGTSGQRISVNYTGSTIAGSCCFNNHTSIKRPDGSLIVADREFGNDGTFVDTTILNATGTYTIVDNPEGARIGSITLTAYDVPADVTGTVAINGSTLTLTTGTAGQNAVASFTGDASRPVTLSVSNITFTGSCCFNVRWSAKNPDGSTLIASTEFGTNGISSTKTLPAAGTYTVTIDPEGARVGSATLKVAPSTSFQTAGQTIGTVGGKGSLALSASELLSDPVNSLTGAYIASDTELTLSGVGVAFQLTRTYTSIDTTQTRLGVGWTDNYSASLTIQPNGDVIAHGEDGQQVRFARQQDGTFAGTPGTLATLTSLSGGYTLVSHEQLTYSFDANGKLQSIVDRNGQGVTLAYDGSGNLATVTDAAGRAATFTSNPDGTLAGISLADGRSVSLAYSGGRLTSSTDSRGKTTTYTYDGSGRLATEVDPNGHTVVSNVYGTDGRISQQTDATGHTTTFAWDVATQTETATDPRGNAWKDIYANNVLIKRIDPLGNVTQFGHDTALDTTSVTGPDNAATTMSYDTRGNLTQAVAPASLAATKTLAYNSRNDVTSVTDARGKVTTFGYDANGNNTTVTQDGQVLATYTYDSQGRVTSFKDGRNNTTTYTYDGNGNLASETDPLGNKTTYTYDSAGRLTAKVEPLGNVQGANPDQHKWTYSYDAAGNLLSETNPLSQSSTYTYDDAGNKLTDTDARNHTTSYTYDAANRLASVNAPDGGVTTYTYDNAGNKLTETDPRSDTTTYSYDADNRLTSVTTPLGNKTTYSYDAKGNQTKIVEPRGNVTGANPNDYTTSSTYDSAGRLLTQTDPLGSTTTYTYDKVGNQTTVKDANNHTTSYAYDGRNRLTTVTAPNSSVTTYTYDANGNLATRADANTHVISYSYDAANHPTSRTLPLSRTWTYSYDANGQLTSTIDANGNATQTTGDGTTNYSYDGAGRLTAIDYSDTTPDISYGYDATGNRISINDGAGAQTYTYDNANRLTGVTRGTNSFTYTYDLAGNITSRTYPASSVVTYSYDNDQRLANVTASGNSTNYSYDAASDLATTTFPAGNGYAETRSYDRAARLTEVRNANGAALLSDFTVTLDPVGNPTTIVRTGVVSETATYTYDSSDRLIGVCYQASCPGAADPFIRWTYDQVGNRLTEARPTGTTTYTYNAADELTAAGSTNYSYDSNGNQTVAGARTFTYDQPGRLATTTAGSTTTTYAYDGDGNRSEATTGSQPSEKTKYLWDTSLGLPQLALERDGNNTLLRRYQYGVARISMATGANDFNYYHYDALGSTVNVTSSTGQARWTYSYEPFGQTRSETSDDPQAPSTPMKFAGELQDSTGFYYLRARQYDATLARFLQPDPADASSSQAMLSTYVYAADRPTVMVDPSGASWLASSASTKAALVSVSPASRGLAGLLPFGTCAGGTAGPRYSGIASRIARNGVVSASFGLVCPRGDITSINASGLLYVSQSPPYKPRPLKPIGTSYGFGSFWVYLTLYAGCVRGTWSYQAIGNVTVIGPTAFGTAPWTSRERTIRC